MDKMLKRAETYITNSYNSKIIPNSIDDSGIYRFPIEEYKNPLLISNLTSIKDKNLIAIEFLKNQTIKYEFDPNFNIGVDLFNRAFLEMICKGAKPLFLTIDYLFSKIHPSVLENILSGVSWSSNNECPTASVNLSQISNMLPNEVYYLACNMVGVVDQDDLIDGSKICSEDVIIGIPSSGLHLEGYSLVKHALLNTYNLNSTFKEIDSTLGEVLLTPHKDYKNMISNLISSYEVRSLIPIKDLGVYNSIKQTIPENLSFSLNWSSWEQQPIFKLIQERGSLSNEDMRNNFNLGIGLAIIVHKNNVESIINWLKFNYNETAIVIGNVHEKNI